MSGEEKKGKERWKGGETRKLAVEKGKGAIEKRGEERRQEKRCRGRINRLDNTR